MIIEFIKALFKKPVNSTAEQGSLGVAETRSESLYDRLRAYAHNKYGLIIHDFVLFAVRGATYKNGELVLNDNKLDEYNDCFLVVNENAILADLEASVDPGFDWVKDPMNKKGTARVENGLYYYKAGLHKGHAAFVQYGKIKVRRDENRDGVWADSEFTEEGFFGINIHWSYSKNKVGRDSAGCMVVRGNRQSDEWNTLLRIFHFQERFAVIVVDGKDL